MRFTAIITSQVKMRPLKHKLLKRLPLAPTAKRIGTIEKKLAALDIVSSGALVVAIATTAVLIWQGWSFAKQTHALYEQTYSDNLEKMAALVAEIQKVETASLVLSDWIDTFNASVSSEASLKCAHSNCDLIGASKRTVEAMLPQPTDNQNGSRPDTSLDAVAISGISTLAHAYSIRGYMIAELDEQRFASDLKDALISCAYISVDDLQKPEGPPARVEAKWSLMQLAGRAGLEFVRVMQSSQVIYSSLFPANPASATGSAAAGQLGSVLAEIKPELCGLGNIDMLLQQQDAIPGTCKTDYSVVVDVQIFLVRELAAVKAACNTTLASDMADFTARQGMRNEFGRDVGPGKGGRKE